MESSNILIACVLQIWCMPTRGLQISQRRCYLHLDCLSNIHSVAIVTSHREGVIYHLQCLSIAGLVYAHQRVSHLTGKVSSIIFTTPMIAAMVNPMVLATLMTRYSNLWYVYIFMMQVVIAMTCFLILHRVTVKLASCRRSTQNMQLKISGELDKNQETCQPFLEKSEQDL